MSACRWIDGRQVCSERGMEEGQWSEKESVRRVLHGGNQLPSRAAQEVSPWCGKIRHGTAVSSSVGSSLVACRCVETIKVR